MRLRDCFIVVLKQKNWYNCNSGDEFRSSVMLEKVSHSHETVKFEFKPWEEKVVTRTLFDECGG